jgi:serine/threonine protein kinase/ABC-type dipeptide/oligopeptide/nickel transport system permease subunit
MIRDVDPYIGQRLGPYELQSKLGAGGMGVVYRAVHRRLGQARAIKVLPALFANDETFGQRFEQEARLASELRHPNIVMIYDIADDNGMSYIVMELLEGRTLREVIHQVGPLAPERAVHLLSQLADALDFAHRRGVTHRDVKPGNALVGPDDHLTLVDFGIARAAETSRLTQTGTRVGTAEYMAPETITLGDTGPGTDLYALGIIAYEAMTGRAPFTGVNSEAILYAQIHTPPPPPHQWRSDLPPSIERVLLQQLSKEPTDRYSTGGDFVRALADAGGVEVEGRTTRHGTTDTGQAPSLSDRPAPPPSTHIAGATDSRAASAMPTPPPQPTPPGGSAPGTGQAVSTPRRGHLPPPPSGVHDARRGDSTGGEAGADAEPLLDIQTLFKLVVGAAMVLLLLMTFLPTPHDPLSTSLADRLMLPRGPAGPYVLGTDAQGRDTLSRLMAGGRFLTMRLCIVALLATAVGLLIRRRARSRGGRSWLTAPRLILAVAVVVSLSVVSELMLAYLASEGAISVGRLMRVGMLGEILLGAPRDPPAASWGGMFGAGRASAGVAPWLAAFPAIGLVVVAVGMAMLGSGLADLLTRRARRAAALADRTGARVS